MIKKHDICRVASLEPLAKDTYALTLKVNGDMLKYFRPGQFAHIRLPHAGEHLLRRPISVNTIDREAGTMRFAFLTQGEGTRRLSQCRPGDELDILAPLGQGFKVKESHQKIWLVGGGIGIAPLLSLLDQCCGIITGKHSRRSTLDLPISRRYHARYSDKMCIRDRHCGVSACRSYRDTASSVISQSVSGILHRKCIVKRNTLPVIFRRHIFSLFD